MSTRTPDTPSTITSITNVRAGASVDTSARTRRYAITMAFRTAAFLLAVTVAHGWLRWALLAGAVFLPYMGVLMANTANEKGLGSRTAGDGEDRPALTATVETGIVSGEVVEGDLLDDGPVSASR